MCVCACLFFRAAMLRNGLLVLNATNVHSSSGVLSTVIESCVKTVCNLLYVNLVNYDISVTTDVNHQSSKQASFGKVLCTHAVRHYVSSFYIEAAAVRQYLEVRFVLGNICGNLSHFPVPTEQRLQHDYEVVLTDLGHDLHQVVANYVSTQFPVNHNVKIIQIPTDANSYQPNSSASTSRSVIISSC